VSYPLGGPITLSTVVTDRDGEPVDDSGAQLVVTDPSGTPTTYTVAGPPALEHTATGAYQRLVIGTALGMWSWEWTVTSGNGGMDSGFFLVGVGPSQKAWCSLEDVLKLPSVKKVPVQDYALMGRCVMGASEFLHSRTWRRFKGLREVELRPCCRHAYARLRAYVAWPMVLAAQGIGSSPDPSPIMQDAQPCGCSPISEIELPDDVQLVTRVLIDGDEYDGWRLDSGRRLTRVDDTAWPCCADVMLPETELNTFSVHIVVGEDIPEMGRLAAAELAGELYLAVVDKGACQIPANITNVSTQGQTWTRINTQTLQKDVGLGLRTVDIFLSQFGRRRRRAMIASPNNPDLGRRKGPGPL